MTRAQAESTGATGRDAVGAGEEEVTGGETDESYCFPSQIHLHKTATRRMLLLLTPQGSGAHDTHTGPAPC